MNSRSCTKILKFRYYRYHGPRPGTLSQPTQPKSPKGIRPKSQPAQERPTDPPPEYPKGIRPKSQPAQERPVDPPPEYPKGVRPKSQPAQERLADPSPGCPGISYPGWLLTKVLTFPIDNSTKRSSKRALHITSVSSPTN